jgi:hypothetical protein
MLSDLLLQFSALHFCFSGQEGKAIREKKKKEKKIASDQQADRPAGRL